MVDDKWNGWQRIERFRSALEVLSEYELVWLHDDCFKWRRIFIHVVVWWLLLVFTDAWWLARGFWWWLGKQFWLMWLRLMMVRYCYSLFAIIVIEPTSIMFYVVVTHHHKLERIHDQEPRLRYGLRLTTANDQSKTVVNSGNGWLFHNDKAVKQYPITLVNISQI